MEADDYCLGLLQLENCLNFLVPLCVVSLITDAVKNVELDQVHTTADEKGKRFVRVETDRGGGAGNKRFQIRERTNLGRDRQRSPNRNLGPHQKRNASLEGLGHSDAAVGSHAGERRTAGGDCHLTAQLLDWADAIKVRRSLQRAQIKRRGELAIHNRLALSADEAKVVSQSLDVDGLIGLRRK